MNILINRFKIYWLIIIMTVISLVIVITSLILLYNSAFEQQQARLADMVKGQASLISAVALYDKNMEDRVSEEYADYNPFLSTLRQLQHAHLLQNVKGMSTHTTVAKIDGEFILFYLHDRSEESDIPISVPLSSPNAEAMRRALRGESGTIVARDHNGVLVLAAYEPIKELGLGLVNKVPLSEIRKPYIHMGLISIGITFLLVISGAFFITKIGNPIVDELMNKELQLKDINASIPGSIYQFVLHKNGQITIPYISENISNKLGIDTSVLIEDASKLYEFIHPADRDSFKNSIHQSAKTMQPWELTFRINTPDNLKTWVYGKSNPSSLPDGSIQWNGIMLDATKQIIAESDLRKSKQIMQAVLNSIPVRVFWKDKNLNYLGCNKIFAQDAGFENPDELIGKNDYDMVWKEQAELYRSDDFSVIDNETEKLNIEEAQTTPSGDQIHLLTSKLPLRNSRGEVYGVLGTYQDISALHNTKEELKKSEIKYRSTIEKLPVGVVVYADDASILIANQKASSILDLTPRQLFGIEPIDSDWCFVYEDKSKMETEDYPINKILSSKEPLFDYVLGVSSPNRDSITWVNVNATTILSTNGDIEKVVISYFDITKNKNAEELNSKLLRAIEFASETVVITDTKGIIEYANPAFEIITGYSVEEAIGKSPSVLKSGKHDYEFYKKLWGTLFSGKVWKGEMINKKKDGTLFTEYAVISPVLDDKMNIVNFVAVKSDITETNRLKALETRATRLESMGVIAGQVAHDFNNLLAPIIGYPSFIKEKLPSDHVTIKYINAIETAAINIAEINQDLLTLGRRAHYNLEPLNLNLILSQTINSLVSQDSNISVKTHFCDDLMVVKGGIAQLSRVFTNLIVNAKDAMDNKGLLTITTENYYLDSQRISNVLVPKGEYVKVTISDTGKGISEEIISKLFEPFFTTKTTDAKRGSGLGLSVVNSVIKDHNGFIDVESKVGEGTSFYIYFPIDRETIEDDNDNYEIYGSEKILIVDDDEVLRDVTSNLLSGLGYSVYTAESGENAVKFLTENSVDLVLLDMIMPNGIDGTETYKQIIAHKPNQPAIIVSGYSASERVIEARKLGVNMFLSKPLTQGSLGKAIRKTLNRKSETVK